VLPKKCDLQYIGKTVVMRQKRKWKFPGQEFSKGGSFFSKLGGFFSKGGGF